MIIFNERTGEFEEVNSSYSNRSFPAQHNNKIVSKVKEIIADVIGLSSSEFSYKSNLKNDLGADDLDIIEIIMSLEEEFGISIPEEDEDLLITVNDVIQYVENQ